MPQDKELILYDYWRSSASYRVRIALNLLGLDYQTVPVNLLQKQHLDQSYQDINPQGLVPSLRIGNHLLTQSLAIIEYLHDTTPDSQLLPSDPADRAHHCHGHSSDLQSGCGDAYHRTCGHIGSGCGCNPE